MQMLLRTGSMTQLLSTRKTRLFQTKNISVHFLTRQYLFTWQVITALFVFLINDPKQNTRSLLMHVSDTAFYALSHGSIGFAPHGSFFNHFPIGQNSSRANQNIWTVFDAAMENKMQASTWKSIKICIRSWCQMWRCILFWAIYRENKQWSV